MLNDRLEPNKGGHSQNRTNQATLQQLREEKTIIEAKLRSLKVVYISLKEHMQEVVL
jgi:hypothetical protein